MTKAGIATLGVEIVRSGFQEAAEGWIDDPDSDGTRSLVVDARG